MSLAASEDDVRLIIALIIGGVLALAILALFIFLIAAGVKHAFDDPEGLIWVPALFGLGWLASFLFSASAGGAALIFGGVGAGIGLLIAMFA